MLIDWKKSASLERTYYAHSYGAGIEAIVDAARERFPEGVEKIVSIGASMWRVTLLRDEALIAG